MPRTHLPEWLLACAAGRTRAAAIYGDLLELAQTRGRLWFWAAYLRTLAQLFWRPAIAFLLGYLVYVLPSFSLSGFFANYVHRGPWRAPGIGPAARFCALLQHWVAPLWLVVPVAVDRLLFSLAGPLLTAVVIPLWFVLPYTAARYGFRDRLVQLACAAFVGSTVVALDPPALTPLFAIISVMAVAATVFLPAWRRPVVVLAITLVAGFTSVAALFEGVALATIYIREQLGPAYYVSGFSLPGKTISLFALFVPAVVCSLLHRWLLERQAAPSHATPTGAAHA